ncbi:MAG: phage holin family protein [Arenimonas sp.]
MNQDFPEPSLTNASAPFNPLGALRLLRSAGKALLGQAGLYGQLARLEWVEEKNRLSKMLAAGMVVFACLLCFMLFAGLLVLALSWNTPYFIAAIVLMIVIYAAGLGVAFYILQSQASLGEQSFTATREEFAADIALIKSKL